jgi:hypothetical protein
MRGVDAHAVAAVAERRRILQVRANRIADDDRLRRNSVNCSCHWRASSEKSIAVALQLPFSQRA